jgi:hypothetical protein
MVDFYRIVEESTRVPNAIKDTAGILLLKLYLVLFKPNYS